MTLNGPYSTKDKDGIEIWAGDLVIGADDEEYTIDHVFKNGKVRLEYDEYTPKETVPGHLVALLARF